MSMGSPDIIVTMPETCQLASNQFAAEEPAAKCGFGTSHVQAATKRCGRSKSETPRFARGSSWHHHPDRTRYQSTWRKCTRPETAVHATYFGLQTPAARDTSTAHPSGSARRMRSQLLASALGAGRCRVCSW